MHKLTWNDGHPNMTSLRGFLKGISVEDAAARITALGGEDLGPGDKTSVEFTGTFNGATFTLYDYWGSHEFHIGGHDGYDGPALDVEAFKAHLTALLDATEPDPAYRKGHFYVGDNY